MIGQPSLSMALFCTTPGYTKDVVAQNATASLLAPFNFGCVKDVSNHSRKPEGFHERLELIYPHRRYLELFARRDRPNWTCVGNQCPSSPGEDIRDSFKRLSSA
jgi:N6-adenosine-specific RNA methylase IME4